MTDITFITSNQTKVAHARYLCKGYDVNILQYKKLFYGVGYNEPRIYDRRELLQRSFDDALRRWEKNVAGVTRKTKCPGWMLSIGCKQSISHL